MTIQTRRSFLAGSAGLVIAVTLSPRAFAQSGAAAAFQEGAVEAGTLAPNAFVRVAPDDTITVVIKHIEFGQGPYTGLSTLVAEEMDADWSQMRAVSAPADDELYKNLLFGMQGTGGSTAMANSYTQMRKAGAAARAMLVAAAAEEWGVPEGEITISKGVMRHAGSDRSSGFGALAEKAATMTAPQEPALKDPRGFRADRHRRAQARHAGQDDGTGDLHARRLSRGHADGRDQAPAALRRQGGELRRFARRCRCRASWRCARPRSGSRSMPRRRLRR